MRVLLGARALARKRRGTEYAGIPRRIRLQAGPADGAPQCLQSVVMPDVRASNVILQFRSALLFRAPGAPRFTDEHCGTRRVLT
jgi:hypothetical protein